MSDLSSAETRKITISEMFAAASFILSAASLLFTGGVVYGQTQDNTRRVAAVEVKIDKAVPDIARMEADINFLVRAEMARQQRSGQFEYTLPPKSGGR